MLPVRTAPPFSQPVTPIVCAPELVKVLSVKVPSGVEDGMRIRLNGEGEVGPGGGPAGDLYLRVYTREHPLGATRVAIVPPHDRDRTSGKEVR